MVSANRPFTPGAPESQERSWMSSIEGRMDVLETQQRLFNSSIRGGAIVVYTDDLEQVARLGDGQYVLPGGVIREAPTFAISNASNAFHALIDMEDGWLQPRWQYSWVEDTFKAVTSAGFTNTWKSMVNVNGLALIVRMLVTADASTTGRARLEFAGQTSDEITIAGGEQKVMIFNWDLTNKVSMGSYHLARIQVQRDSGAGNINSYAPEDTYTTSLRMISTATPGGIPTA